MELIPDNSILADDLVDSIFPGKFIDDLLLSLPDSLFPTSGEIPSTRVCCEGLGRTDVVLVLQVFALICVRVLFILVTRLWCNGQTGMRSPVVSSWKMHSHGCFLEGCAHGGQDWRSCLQAFHT